MNRFQTFIAVSLALMVLVLVTMMGRAISESIPTGLFTIENVSAEDIAKYFENGELKPEFVQIINQNIGQVPPELVNTFAQGKTNLTLVTDEGKEVDVTVQVDGGKLESAQQGHSANADAEIKIDEATIQKISKSDEPAQEIVKAINAGEIKYTPVSNGSKLKNFFLQIISFLAGIVLAIFSFFRAIFGL